MAVQKQDDQLELTYSKYVRTQDVILKTSRRRWTIGRSGERWSGISVLAARHDDEDGDIMKIIPTWPRVSLPRVHQTALKDGTEDHEKPFAEI